MNKKIHSCFSLFDRSKL